MDMDIKKKEITSTPGPEIKSTSNKNKPLIIGVIIVLIVAVGGGTAWWFLLSPKALATKYVKAVEPSYKKFVEKVEQSKFNAGGGDKFSASAKNMQDEVSEIKKLLSEAKSAQQKASAPSELKELDANLREVYSLVDESLSEYSEFISYLSKAVPAFESLEKLGSSSTESKNLETLTSSLEQDKKKIQSSLDDIKAITPPTSMLTIHKDLKDLLKEMIDMYNQLIAALKGGNFENLSTIVSESTLTDAISKFTNDLTSVIDNSKIVKNKDKMESLKDQIDAKFKEVKDKYKI